MNIPFDLKKLTDSTRDGSFGENHTEDSEFLPVVIAASVALIVILIVAVAVVGGTGKDLIPQNRTLHTISQIVMSQHGDMA